MSAPLQFSRARVTSATLLALMLGLAVAGCGGGGGSGPGLDNGGGTGPSTNSISVTGRVTTTQRTVSSNGSVVNDIVGVPNVIVTLKGTNISGATDSNGQYLLNNIPASTSQSILVKVPTGYVPYVTVNNKTYSQSSPSCAIPLATLQNGSNAGPSITLSNQDSPPPPPTGACPNG